MANPGAWDDRDLAAGTAGKPGDPACPVCGARDCRDFATHEGIELLSCADCGTVFMYPMPSPERVTEIYDDAYDGATAGYFAKVDKKIRRSRGRMRYLSRFVGAGSFLDIGCNGGFMVEAARERGFDAHGLDIDGVSIAYARRHYPNNSFFHGTIENFATAPEALRFDLVYCSEVIEHLPDVQGFAAAVAGLLRPGGAFFITTPDISHWRRPPSCPAARPRDLYGSILRIFGIRRKPVKFNPMKYRIPLLKRAVPSIKKRIAQATWRGGYAIKESNGALFLLNYRNFVDRQIAFYDDFEAEQRRYLFAGLAKHGCDLFLDVGANIGFYSILVARSGLADRVVAFEPDGRNRLQMGANLLINGLVSKVEIVPKAVTEESGMVDFLPSPDTSTGQSRVGEGAGAIHVEAICLDDFIGESDLRVFIKMDIEGHEPEAVRGMGRLLRNNRIFMQVESFPENVVELTESLAGYGLARCHQIGDDYYFSNF